MPGTLLAGHFVPDNADYHIRYGPNSKFQTATVFMPNWTPSLVDLPEWPVAHMFKGGTWAGALGFDALGVNEGGFQEEVMLMLSNDLGAVIICHDYRPGGVGDPLAEDYERIFWPEILDDGARVVQWFRTIAVDERWGDRPLTRDPDLILGFGASSGGHRLAFASIMPDGTFDYSPGGVTRDPYFPKYTHILNPMIVSSCPLIVSTFSKGGPDYSYYGTYGEAGWPFALFKSSQHEVDLGYGDPDNYGWDHIPMALKRQSDLSEHIRADNPRVSQIGLYLTGPHESAFQPPAALHNDPTSVDPRSWRRWYWRSLGIDPQPIENIRPVRDSVQAIASAVPGEGIFRTTGTTWVADGWAAAQLAVADGFPILSNDSFSILRFENSDLDMVVEDLTDLIVDEAGAPGQTVAGGGHYSLHDVWPSYAVYDEMLAQGNLKCRLRAGGSANTNPDPLTINNLATADDVKLWLTATDGTGFAWAVPT